MNDGWIPFSCFSFRVLVLCVLARCHTVTVTAIINVVSNTCSFLTMTDQKAKTPLLFQGQFSLNCSNIQHTVQTPGYSTWTPSSQPHTDLSAAIQQMVLQHLVPHHQAQSASSLRPQDCWTLELSLLSLYLILLLLTGYYLFTSPFIDVYYSRLYLHTSQYVCTVNIYIYRYFTSCLTITAYSALPV